MRKISNRHLAQLLMQLRFTSAEKRLQFLESTERLLEIIEPEKGYPFDFVCYRITGYHPKDLPQELINGKILAADLRIFLWRLSGKVTDNVVDKNEKVYTIDELAQMLRVSARTIIRWRQRGLLSRKYTFDNGTKRVAVTETNLDKFLKKNPNLAGKAGTFTRLSKEEKKLIISEAKKIAPKSKNRYAAIKKIAEKTGRGIETIRKIVSDYDMEHPKKPLFKSYMKRLDTSHSAEIYRLHKQGINAEKLAERFKRSKSYIYRIIRRKKAKALLITKIEYIYSGEFQLPDAERDILGTPLGRMRPNIPRSRMIDLTGGPVNKYLQSIKNISRLTRQRETELFRKYNYLKFLAADSQQQLRLGQSSGAHIRRIEKCLRQAEVIKNTIIEANLPLVVGIARRHSNAGAPLQELLSEGNFSLMRAVEGFDYTRGFRFATYASWVIAKNFARRIPSKAKKPGKVAAGFLDNIQRDLRLDIAVDFGAIERARHSLVQVIKNELNEREQYVILHHYDLADSRILKKAKTLQQIGDEMHLSKERVRQIELSALQKLKQSLSIEEFELLTG